MLDLWWRLPGPKSYMERIGRSLIEGQNVIAIIPEGEIRGLKDAVCEWIVETRPFKNLNLDNISNPKASPARYIHELFDRRVDASTVFNARTLTQLNLFGGYAVWVENIAEEDLTNWFRFLESYQHACQCHDSYNRGTICIAIPSHINKSLPKCDIALVTHSWNNAVDRFDISTYINYYNSDKNCNSLLRRLKTVLISELSLTDRQLASTLISYNLNELIDNTLEILSQNAHEKGWTLDQCKNPTCDNGTLVHIEGSLLVHSSALAILDNHQTIERRIWTAQVSVLFPALEQARISLLNELDGFLTVPFLTEFEKIDKIEGLELGHIWHQIKNKVLPSRLRTLIYQLLQIRINLAHLTPLKYSSINNPQLLRYLSGEGIV